MINSSVLLAQRFQTRAYIFRGDPAIELNERRQFTDHRSFEKRGTRAFNERAKISTVEDIASNNDV